MVVGNLIGSRPSPFRACFNYAQNKKAGTKTRQTLYPNCLFIHKGERADPGVKGQTDPGIIGGSVAAGVCVVLLLAFAITLLCILKRRRFSTKRLAIVMT